MRLFCTSPFSLSFQWPVSLSFSLSFSPVVSFLHVTMLMLFVSPYLLNLTFSLSYRGSLALLPFFPSMASLFLYCSLFLSLCFSPVVSSLQLTFFMLTAAGAGRQREGGRDNARAGRGGVAGRRGADRCMYVALRKTRDGCCLFLLEPRRVCRRCCVGVWVEEERRD